MDLDSVSVHKHAKKKELGQYPAILISHLINNPYIHDLDCISVLERAKANLAKQATGTMILLVYVGSVVI